MKLVLTYVSTLNGKITKGDDDDVTKWSSKEDQEHFKRTEQNFSVLIKSSSTYEASKSKVDSNPETRHIVMTRTPQKYAGRPDHIEFTNESPSELIERLEKEGVERALLSVGGKMVSKFFEEGLISELYLTLEPKVFGRGVDMVSESDFFTNLKLRSIDQLNDEGTLLLVYDVMG